MFLGDILKKNLDPSVSLAGSQWGEVILVRLREGGPLFGVGAFCVKEAIPWRRALPGASGVEGAAMDIDVRGARVCLFDLGRLLGASGGELKKGVALLAEAGGGLRGFGVHSIDGVSRVDWSSARESDKGGELFAMEARSESGEPIVVLGLGRRSAAIDPALVEPPTFDAETIFSVGTSPATQAAIEEGAQSLGIHLQKTGSLDKAWGALQESLRLLGSEKIAAIVVEAEAREGAVDGYSFARRIKSDERFKEIPIILSASASARPSQAMGLQIGADGFIHHASAQSARAAFEKLSGKYNPNRGTYGS